MIHQSDLSGSKKLWLYINTVIFQAGKHHLTSDWNRYKRAETKTRMQQRRKLPQVSTRVTRGDTPLARRHTPPPPNGCSEFNSCSNFTSLLTIVATSEKNIVLSAYSINRSKELLFF